MDNNLKIAETILKCIGGKENVVSVFHCATRMRFSLKDENLVNEEELKKTKGVLGVTKASDMYQVIIGQNVESVYDHFCKLAGIKANEVVNETLDEELVDKKLTIKKIFKNIFSYVTGSMAPIIYPLLGAALINTIGILVGPSVLNLVASDSPFVLTCDMLYDGLFYFLPIYIGYSAAKTLKISNPVWGMLIGGIIITPDFVALASAGTTDFSLFGFLPVTVASYGQTIVPTLIGVWVFKYLYKFLQKIIPEAIFGTFAPIIIYFVMGCLMFGAIAPAATVFGNVLSDIFQWMYGSILPVRLIGYILLCALWPIITLAGMHMPIFYTALAIYFVNGYDPFVIAVASCSVYVTYGMALGAVFKFKKKEHKASALSAFIAGFIGAVCEPSIYSVALKSKSATTVMVAAGGILGAVLCFLQPTWNNFGSGNILGAFVCWAGGAPGNLVKGLIGCGLGMLLGALGVILFAKFDEEEF